EVIAHGPTTPDMKAYDTTQQVADAIC
ncbi:hypothetical protein NVE83_09580, partial [Escherichia coli]